jgi:hypothetical protein
MSHHFSEPLASFIPKCLVPKKPMCTLAPGCKSPAEPQGAHVNSMIKPLLAVTRSLQYPTHTHVNTATGQTPSCHSEPRVGGPRSSSSFSCTCICILNYFFSLTDKGSFTRAASASAILLQHTSTQYATDTVLHTQPTSLLKHPA